MNDDAQKTCRNCKREKPATAYRGARGGMTAQQAERLVALWCAGQPLDDLPQWRTAMQVLSRELADTRAKLAAERNLLEGAVCSNEMLGHNFGNVMKFSEWMTDVYQGKHAFDGVEAALQAAYERGFMDGHAKGVAAEREIERLRAALDYASSGFALAYDAAEKRLNDEVLLHCGHHQARVDKTRAG